MKRVISRMGGLANLGVMILALAGVNNAAAQGIVYDFDHTFSGTPPSGAAPWVEATFTDVSGGVMLTINNINVTPSEKITAVYFNIDPADTSYLGQLNFARTGGTASVATPSVAEGEDSYKADGDGYYDMKLVFSQPPASAFTSGDWISFLITGVPGLTSSAFIGTSTHGGGTGQWFAAMHVQGISATSDNDSSAMSGWANPSMIRMVGVPEPSSAALLGAAACLPACARWLKRRGRKE